MVCFEMSSRVSRQSAACIHLSKVHTFTTKIKVLPGNSRRVKVELAAKECSYQVDIDIGGSFGKLPSAMLPCVVAADRNVVFIS